MKTSLKNLTKEHTYYKNPSNPNYVDLIIIRKNVQHSHVTEILQDRSYLQQKRKFATQTNSNMLNSMMMFTFYVLDQKYPFWSKNDVFLRWKLAFTPIQVC